LRGGAPYFAAGAMMRPESVSPVRGLEAVDAGSVVGGVAGDAFEEAVVGGVGSVVDGGGPPYLAPQLTFPKTSAELTATTASVEIVRVCLQNGHAASLALR